MEVIPEYAISGEMAFEMEHLGLTLVTIHNQAQQDFFYNLMLAYPYSSALIGWNDRDREGVHVWGDGSNTTYRNDINNFEDKDCYVLSMKKATSGKWMSSRCPQEKAALMQRQGLTFEH